MDYKHFQFENDETCYFSALDEFPLDSIDQRRTQQQALEEEQEEEDNYYTHLRADQMASRNYTSLRFVPNFGSRLNDLNESDLDYEEIMRKEREKTPVYTRKPCCKCQCQKQDDEGFNDDYSVYLDSLKEEILRSFEKKIKNKKIKHFNLDQTLDEVLDEYEYDNVLDDLVKSIAKSKYYKKSDSSRGNSRGYYNNHSTDREDYSGREYSNMDPKKMIDNALKEYPVLGHIFEMIKNCNMSDFSKLIKEFTHRINRLSGNGSESVKLVGNVFVSLINLDLKNLVKNFIAIPLRDKWNVLKNLIYYSVKMTIVGFSQVFLNESTESFSNILNSIYLYVKNFERIQF